MTADTPPSRERFIVAAAMALAAFALYAKTLCGDVFWQDSGLYNRSVFLLGSGVPPGFPSYHLFCYLFTMVPALGAVAGMNLASAVAGAATAFFVVLLVYELVPAGAARAAAAAVAALAYAAAPTIWLQSTTCEVYTLNMALAAATMLALFAWRRRADVRLLYLAAFIYGLACANHPQQAVLLLPYAAFLAWHGRRAGLRAGHLLGATALWLAAMSTYLYLPIRSAAGVAMNWGNPRTLYGLYYHLTCKEFQRQMFSSPWPVVWWRVRSAAWLYVDQFTWAGLAAAALGAAWLAWRRRADFFYFALVAAATLFLTVNYPSFGFRAWFFPFYMLTAICAGLAVGWLAASLGRRRRAAAVALAAVAVVAAALPVLSRFYRADRTDYPYGRDYAANYLRPLGYRAMFFMGEENSSATGGIEALNTVEYFRPDVFLVDLTGNKNYFDIFDFGGRDLKHVPDEVISRYYLEVLEGVVARPDREYYFLYPYDYVRAWGYGFAPEGLVVRLVTPEYRPRADEWPRNICRGVSPAAAYRDYWAQDAVGDYFFKMGEAYRFRDAAFAARAYRLADRIGGGSTTIQHNLGTVYFTAKDYSRAAPYFERTLALEPTLSMSRFLLAACYRELGRGAAARRELRETLRYEPTFEPARLALETGVYAVW